MFIETFYALKRDTCRYHLMFSAYFISTNIDILLCMNALGSLMKQVPRKGTGIPDFTFDWIAHENIQ